MKLFVIASDEVRAARRFAELQAAGADTTLEATLSELRERDARDQARASAPLVAAKDARVIDTTGMTIDEAVEKAAGIVSGAL